jgi:hypothetical protein
MLKPCHKILELDSPYRKFTAAGLTDYYCVAKLASGLINLNTRGSDENSWQERSQILLMDGCKSYYLGRSNFSLSVMRYKSIFLRQQVS